MAKKANQQPQAPEQLDSALPALNITPNEGENIVTFGERLCDTFKGAFAPFIEQLKNDYGNAVAVYEQPDTVNHVKEGHKLAVTLRTTISKQGVEQRRPFREIVTSHKSAEDEVIAEIKPVEQHLKQQVDSIERREQEERRKLTEQRVKALEEAGFQRSEGVMAARMVIVMIDTVADLEEADFIATLERGKAEIAEQARFDAEKAAAAAALKAQQEELEKLRAEIAALKAEKEEPEPNLTKPEDLELPKPKPAPAEVAPEPELKAQQPSAPSFGRGLHGTETGKERNQSFVNGFKECQQQAVAAIQGLEKKTVSGIIAAIQGLKP
jgi:hypothetical protein